MHYAQIDFLGEEGVDGGGPRREFWRLVALSAEETMFCGTRSHKFPIHSSQALQVGFHTNTVFLRFERDATTYAPIQRHPRPSN